MALLQGGSKEAMKVHIETVQPKWLAGVWPGAEIVTVFLDMFDSLRDASHRNLADCIKAATGAQRGPEWLAAASLLHRLLRQRDVFTCTCSARQWRPSGRVAVGTVV